MANNGVQFRRIGGRVVPIHDRGELPPSPTREGLKQVAQAGALAVGGGLAVAGVGRVAAHLRGKSKFLFKGAMTTLKAKNAVSKTGQLSFALPKAGAVAKAIASKDKAVLFRYTSKALRTMKNPVLTAIGIGAGTLAYTGVSRAISNEHQMRHPTETTAIKAGVAAAAAFAVPVSYYKGIGTSLRGAFKYAGALKTGRINRFPRLAIKTALGPVKF